MKHKKDHIGVSVDVSDYHVRKEKENIYIGLILTREQFLKLYDTMVYFREKNLLTPHEEPW